MRFLYFMSKQIQIFDLEPKILFRFDIETRADHNFMFQFDLETKCCVLLKLFCARKKNQSKKFNISVLKGKKERIICFSVIESKKRIAFGHTKNEMLTSLLTNIPKILS
jgi:hypothetical protein